MDTLATSAKALKINSLTGLRFCAAYMVVISHVFGGYSLGINDSGGASVQLFFVLSGFVMYLNYAKKINSKSINFTRFYLLRWIRLYPVYFLSITAYLIFYLHLHTPFAVLSPYYLSLIHI